LRLGIIDIMAEKPARRKRAKPSHNTGTPQDGASNVRLHPLTPEQDIRGMFQISPKDVRRIIASKPGRKKG
jgi:hypothetical protein